MLKKDYDFYYLIICSRGPGSETITVRKVNPKATQLAEGAKKDRKELGVFAVDAEFNDEGPIIAVPAGTMPLDKIYQWLQRDIARFSSIALDAELEKEFPESLQLPTFDYDKPYLSACLRAFLPSTIEEDDNPWTSVNAWRKLEIELPSKAQFEKLMQATGLTADELEKWDCKVMSEAARRYKAEELGDVEFGGC